MTSTLSIRETNHFRKDLLFAWVLCLAMNIWVSGPWGTGPDSGLKGQIPLQGLNWSNAGKGRGLVAGKNKVRQGYVEAEQTDGIVRVHYVMAGKTRRAPTQELYHNVCCSLTGHRSPLFLFMFEDYNPELQRLRCSTALDYYTVTTKSSGAKMCDLFWPSLCLFEPKI